MTTTIQNENMVTVKFSAEGFTFSGMNKQQIEALLGTAVKFDLIVHGCNGQQIKLEIMQDIEIESLTVEDEEGNEIQSSDEVSAK